MRFIGYIAVILLFLISCNQDKQEKARLVVVKKIVESFEESKLSDTEIIEYEYAKPGDVFWTKAVFKDDSGEVYKTVTRELELKTKLPIKEFIEESGEITESYKIIYSAKNHELLYKEEYEGEIKPENKIRLTKWKYENGNLVSQTVTVFSNEPEFINQDGNNIKDTYQLRYFLSKNAIPKGNFELDYFIEYRKKYDTETGSKTYGNIIIEERTEFDENGYPVYHYSTELDCSHAAKEEWFMPKIDSNRKLILLTGFADKYHKSVNNLSSQFHFEYNSDGYIERITEFKYNPETREYSKFHDMQFFSWIIPDMKNRGNISEYNYINEHYCFTGKRHFRLERKIIKSDDYDKKIVEKYFDAYSGKYKSQDLKLDLTERTTYIYK